MFCIKLFTGLCVLVNVWMPLTFQSHSSTSTHSSLAKLCVSNVWMFCRMFRAMPQSATSLCIALCSEGSFQCALGQS